MKPLFSEDGERALAAVMARRPLLAFDFDGTLAPIVDRPADAQVPAPIAVSLNALSLRLPVAVITGRAVSDVRTRLGFLPAYVLGNHGAEDPSGELAGGSLHRLAICRNALARQAPALGAAGITIEDKQFSLALHYRLAPDPAAAFALLQSLQPEWGEGLNVFHGKFVTNLAPDDAPDKADAVIALLARSGREAAVFLGDDLNDEPVFERADSHWLTVRVGRDGPPSKARFFLDDHAQVATLLARMEALLPPA
jgi:trehalose 6-phosphate phosphatase